ncbi:hypothetical protein CRUP_025236 [Coryphaenoides rupestris]|nr:hypothetical protein CRUP_025236 [Coryphaenoides rupestris]
MGGEWGREGRRGLIVIGQAQGWGLTSDVKTCGSSLQGPSGTFTSPNFPIQWRPAIGRVSWRAARRRLRTKLICILRTPPHSTQGHCGDCSVVNGNDVIQINFEEFDMEIAYDTLTIGDGGEVGDPTTILQVFGAVRVEGTVVVVVVVVSVKVIQINFEEFDMEIAYDTLTIGDGGEVGDPTTILQVLSGSFVPDLIVSLTHQMWLHLQSDESVGSIGFKINYKDVSPPPLLSPDNSLPSQRCQQESYCFCCCCY